MADSTGRELTYGRTLIASLLVRDWLRKNRRQDLADEFDENIHSHEPDAPDPERRLFEGLDAQRVQQALEELPAEFREAIVLRELEGLSYKEIGDIAGVPIGTVMSRLARAPRVACAEGARWLRPAGPPASAVWLWK